MGSSRKPSITAIILTRDESLHIRRCIESLIPVVERVCVIDSGSTDDTARIALSLGAEVYENPWINHAAQCNWALEHCAITSAWVLRLDADEYLEPELQSEITQHIPLLAPGVSGVLLKRKCYFMGRWVRHGGVYPLFLLRLWRHGQARVENRWMDEHAYLLAGSSVRFEATFVDDNLQDLAWWSRKHVNYATLEAVQVLLDRLGMTTDDLAQQATRDQATTKRRVKNSVYNRLPLGVGPSLYAAYRLFLRLGVLDGPTGIAFHTLQGFWYRLLVDVRRYELGRRIEALPTPAEKVEALEALTGLRIREFRSVNRLETALPAPHRLEPAEFARARAANH